MISYSHVFIQLDVVVVDNNLTFASNRPITFLPNIHLDATKKASQ